MLLDVIPRLKQFPYFAADRDNSVTLYHPFPISVSKMGVEESSIVIPTIEASFRNGLQVL